MNRNFLLLLALAMIFTSCTLTEHIHFNNDFSGHVEYTVDYSLYASMMALTDESEGSNIDIDSIMKESIAAGNLDSYEGISNFAYVNDSINQLLIITYGFANLDALNKFSDNSQNIEKTLTGASKREFSADGKKLTYISPVIEGNSQPEGYEELKDSYMYKLILSFDRKVKKVSNPNAKLSDDKKQVILEGDLFTLFSREYDRDLIINLK